MCVSNSAPNNITPTQRSSTTHLHTHTCSYTHLQFLPLQGATLVAVVPFEQINVQRRRSRAVLDADRQAAAAGSVPKATSCDRLHVVSRPNASCCSSNSCICKRRPPAASPAASPAAWSAAAGPAARPTGRRGVGQDRKRLAVAGLQRAAVGLQQLMVQGVQLQV